MSAATSLARLDVRVLDDARALDGILPAWRDLVRRGGAPTVFQTPE